MGRNDTESTQPPRQRRRVGLSPSKEFFLKTKLRKTAPSEPWVEEQIISTYDTDASGEPIQYVYYDKTVFPPGGPDTRMVRCSECGILTPPQTIEHGKCLDHAQHKGWGPSPSARSIRRMERFRIIEEPIVILAPEDEESLLREIEEWKQQQQENTKRGTVD